MTRQNISTGTAANDGTGDTLRSAGTKINDNFIELYTRLGGDSTNLSSQIYFEDSAIVFEGSSTDSFETRLVVADPSADRVVSIPNASGVIVIDTATQTLTNKTLTTPKVNTSINDTNGNEVIKVTATSSAVNEITIANAATGNGPNITASSSVDTNINLRLNAAGTGSVRLNKVAIGTAGEQTTDGAASTAGSYVICNKNSGGALLLSLANGTTLGEYKVFTNKGTENAVITPSNFAQGTSVTLSQYDGASMIWDGDNWYLVGNQGEILVTP